MGRYDGSGVKLGEVGNGGLGAEKYDDLSRFNGNPASGLGVKLPSGANEMATPKVVLPRPHTLPQYLRHRLAYKSAYEIIPCIHALSLQSVQSFVAAHRAVR
uniref:efflux RND transporter permease subunit n=1 Tax=Salmonella enterica TaxID=28901 RepID=UPI00398C37B2